MRITARNSRRRRAGQAVAPVLLVLLCASASAQEEPGPWMPVVAKLASSLSQNDAVAALETFDRKAPAYAAIEGAISALVAQVDILCALDVVESKARGNTAVLDVDWYMQLTSQSEASRTERRRERVQLQVRLDNGKWKIVSLTPVSIIDPIHINRS